MKFVLLAIFAASCAAQTPASWNPKFHACLGPLGSQSMEFPICYDEKTRQVDIDSKYDIKKVFWMMFDREHNAWKQLLNLTDAQDNFWSIHEAAKHAHEDFASSPRVSDVKWVSINRTIDNGALTIELTNSSGKHVTLWLTGDSKQTEGNFTVRSYSPY